MINVKALITYLLMIGLAVLYTLFLEPAGGCYLIAALTSAAVISAALCVYSSRMLKAELETNGDILDRGSMVNVTLVLTNTGVLPSTFVNAEMFASYHLTTDDPVSVRSCVFGKSTVRFTASYRAGFFGKGKAGISSLYVTDFLGLFRMGIELPKGMAEIKVCPDIPGVNSREGLARSLTDAAAFDESEETTQSLFAVNGTPGYEHRKYEPGDSLKLINWKLSAKRGEYYVRRLEGASGAEQIFILDKAGSRSPDPFTKHSEEQLAAEGMLALMMQFARTELPCRLMIKLGDVWETIPAVTVEDVSDIRFRMTDFAFEADSAGRLPQNVEGHAVVFTARCDNIVSGFVSGTDVRSAASPAIEVPGENIWLITRDEDDIRFIR
ncbi:MAG: DUF58 domain-containing protein [Ruminiclostridium sp.]|nr:DUF58 domain-containing protein [Ruminiclostridium sp.]